MEAFLVRVWRSGADEPYDGLRGTVVHLGSGRQLTFSEPASLLEFLNGTAELRLSAPGLADPGVEPRDR